MRTNHPEESFSNRYNSGDLVKGYAIVLTYVSNLPGRVCQHEDYRQPSIIPATRKSCNVQYRSVSSRLLRAVLSRFVLVLEFGPLNSGNSVRYPGGRFKGKIKWQEDGKA